MAETIQRKIPRAAAPDEQSLHGRPATYADYRNLPESAPYQLIHGRLIMSASPNRYHQIVSGELEYALRRFVKENKAGDVYDAPFDVKFSDENVFQPDIVFVSNERRSILTEQGAEGAPDLVIEIISPSTGYYDLGDKRRVYAIAGVREFGTVDLRSQRVEVYANASRTFELQQQVEEEGTVRSQVLDGFSVALADIFPW